MKYAKQTAATAFIVLSLCLWVVRNDGFLGWELSLYRFVYAWPYVLLPVFKSATFLGSLSFSVVVFIFLLLKKKYLVSVRFVWASLFTALVVALIKLAIHRPRPYAVLGFASRDIGTGGYGFPSGHTAQATVLAFTLWKLVPRSWRPLLVVGIGLVALSRIYLAVHAPLDVIGGACVGLLGSIIATQLPLLSRLEKRILKA